MTGLAGSIVTETGCYVDKNRVIRSSDESYDLNRERELWTEVAKLTGIHR